MLYWQDIRYAFRLLRKNAGLSLLTVGVLGGGLGVSIFTFSFLYTAMLRPLPVGGGDRIVRVSQTSGSATTGIDAVDLDEVRGSITTLTDVGAFTSRELVAGNAGTQRRVMDATAAEWNIFEATRTRPALGRTFTAADQERGAEPVVVLSYRTWQTSFGADSSLVGRTIALNDVATRVIGVMPAGYAFPVAADAWVPLGMDALTPPAPRTVAVDLYARLRDGVSMRAAETQLQALVERARRSRPVAPDSNASSQQVGMAPEPIRVRVETFPRAQMGEEGPLFFVVLNLLAALILLLACVNVVNLLLARANERGREMAVRLALGASRSRLVVQSLWESMMLTVAAGIVATGITAWALSGVNAWAQANMPGNLAFWWVWRLDRPALVAAGVFVTATIALIGGVVAARATNVRISAVLQDSSVRGGGRRQSRLGRALVVTQVATVSVLMFFGVMAGIVANRVVHIDLGFDTRNLMTTRVVPPEQLESRAQRVGFYASLGDALAQSGEIETAALGASLADLQDARGRDKLELDGGARSTRIGVPRAFVRAVFGPLEPFGSGVLEGRAFDTRDSEDGPPTAIVSRAFAARYWPGSSPVGREVHLVGVGETRRRVVVGVARDVLLGNPLSRDRSPLAVYVPLAQTDAPDASLTFRHRGTSAAAVAAVHRALATLDPSYVPSHVATFDEILEKTALIARSVTKLFTLCFGFALLLAVSGTYALMAQSIGQRTREIGVRRALGATDGTIVKLLLGQGGRQLGIGAAIALPFLLTVGIGFSKFFPIATSLSVAAGVLVTGSIVGVVLAATYLPARRALSVTPREALWTE
ncbi:MAG TPA: ABC transporter permease [Gemmatimonadaceae bacterium]|nr:ABC transporter permease [Gemmatimonadaceae bacterium]